MSADLKFWGEGKCEAKMQGGRHQGLRCIKKAYYSQGRQVLCGMHSSAGKRKPLGKNPEAKVNAEKMAEDLNVSGRIDLQPKYKVFGNRETSSQDSNIII